MKASLKLITSALLVSLAVCGASSCSGSNETTEKEVEKTAESLIDEWINDTEWDDSGSESGGGDSTGGSVDIDPKTIDYSKVDVTFGPNDGTAVSEFTEKFYDGSCDGKVVKITGISENWGSGSCTIYSNVDESERWGISWVYADGEALPENDVNLEITGVIMQVDDWGSRNLVALPENVKVVKSDGTPWATELNYSGNIDLEIGLEDKEALTELKDAMYNYECEYDGKTVKIDGIQPTYMEGEIGIVDPDGSITSVTWQLPEGKEFPPTGYRIQIVGEVQTVSDYGEHAVVVDPGNIAVIAPFVNE